MKHKKTLKHVAVLSAALAFSSNLPAATPTAADANTVQLDHFDGSTKGYRVRKPFLYKQLDRARTGSRSPAPPSRSST